MLDETCEVRTRDGCPLHLRRWAPPGRARFVVALVHDLGEHVGRLEEVAGWFGEARGLSFGADLRGFGRSGGPRGDVDSVATLGDDLDEAIAAICRSLPAAALPDEVPWFLFGHGHGALVALDYLLARGEDHPFAGAILSAPVIAPAGAPGPIGRWLAGQVTRVAPSSQVALEHPGVALSRDPAAAAAADGDRLRVRRVTRRLVAALDEARARVVTRVGEVEVPALWYIGSADRIAERRAVEALVARLPEAARERHTLRIFDGYFHDLHAEPELLRRPVRELVVGWVEARLGR